jgi:hypothetical protein
MSKDEIENYIADATRYRRLAKLVEEGSWSVSRLHEDAIDVYLEELYDKGDIDDALDEIEISFMDNIDIEMLHE